MKLHFLILLIAIFSLSEERNQFGNEYTKNFKNKLSKFIAFIKNKTFKSMYDHIVKRKKWIDMVGQVKKVLTDYGDDEEGEEKISNYSVKFCGGEDLKVPKTSIETCKNFVKGFYSCMLRFPFCLDEIIPN